MPERDAVLEALRAEDVANHYQIAGTWRGRWLRSKRCPKTDHGTDAMGLARDGKWHCHACDIGGDLLHLIAFAEGLDVRADFPAVLELAAAIAGLGDVDDFGGGAPSPPKRPPPPPVAPIAARLDTARRRAEYAWGKLFDWRAGGAGDAYLGARGIAYERVHARETLKTTPIRIGREELARVKARSAQGGEELERLAHMFTQAGIACPVRSVADGRLVDIRVRRFDPRDDQPKIVGMVGGVVRDGNELLGCYGRPHELDAELVVIVEGLADYLTALALWPDADVLGAVDAGSYPLVASFAAQALAERDDDARILLVEQNDVEKTKDGKVIPGAADRAVNLGASKRAIALLGPRRVGWLWSNPHKDLNDAVRAGAKLEPVWWSEVSDFYAQAGAM